MSDYKVNCANYILVEEDIHTLELGLGNKMGSIHDKAKVREYMNIIFRLHTVNALLFHEANSFISGLSSECSFLDEVKSIMETIIPQEK